MNKQILNDVTSFTQIKKIHRYIIYIQKVLTRK